MRPFIACLLLALSVWLVRANGAAAADVRSVPLVSCDFHGLPVRNAVEALFRQEGVRAIYRWPAPENTSLINLRRRDKPLDELLGLVLKQADPPLDFRVLEGRYLILTPEWAEAFDHWEEDEREELAGAHVVAQTGHPSPIVNMAFSPDGKWLATGCDEQVVHLWDFETGISRFTLPGRLGPLPFTPNSQALITAVGEDVFFWDLHTGRKVGKLGRYGEKAHVGGGMWQSEAFNTRRGAVRYGVRHGGVETATFTPRGDRIITTGWDRAIKIWRPSGRLLYTIPTPGLVHNIAVNEFGNRLAGTVLYADPDLAGKKEKAIYLWDIAEQPRELKPIVTATPMIAAWFSPDSKRLFAADEKDQVGVWDAWTGDFQAAAAAPIGGGGRRCALAWAPGGKRIYASAPQGGVQVWDAETLQPEAAPVPTHEQDVRWAVSALAFDRAGELAVGIGSFLSHQDKVRLWNTEQMKPVRTYSGDAMHINQVLTAPDGSIICGGTAGIRVWHPQLAEPPRYLPDATPMALSRDGKLLVTRHGFDSLRVWELASGQVINTIDTRGVPWSSSLLAFSPDGDRVALGPGTNELAIYDLHTGARVCTMTGHRFPPRSLVFSPDGNQVVSLGDREDQTLRFWDANTGKELLRLDSDSDAGADIKPAEDPRAPAKAENAENGEKAEKPEKPGKAGEDPEKAPRKPGLSDGALAFSPNGKLVALFLRNRVRVFSADLKTPYRVLDGAALPIFDPQSRTVAVEAPGRIPRIEFWEWGTARRPTHVFGSMPLKRFSPDGHFLVTWDRTQNSAWFFDLSKPDKRKHLVGHTGRLEEATFTPDSRWVVTASQDGTVRIWDTRTGKETAALLGIGSTDYMVETPDNYYMASRGAVYASVALRVGDETFPFKQADLQLNRPDLVLQRLEKPAAVVQAAHEEVEWRLQRYFGRDEDGHLRTPPVPAHGLILPRVTVTKLPTSTTERKRPITIHCEAAPYTLSSVHVLVNDVPVDGSQGRALPEGKTEATVDTTIDLSDGENVVVVYARNAEGLESYQKLQRITYTGPPHQPDLYVVAVGVSRYHDPGLRLEWAAKDADDLVQYLQSLGSGPPEVTPPFKPAVEVAPDPKPAAAPAPRPPAPAPPRRPAPRGTGKRTAASRKAPYRRPPAPRPPVPPPSDPGPEHKPLALKGKAGTFAHVYVQLLQDGFATRENILHTRELLKQSHPDDQVVVFLAGHGILDRSGRYYFATADASREDVGLRGIPYEELEFLVNGIPSRKKMLLLDSCHSGERDDAPTLPEPAPMGAPPAADRPRPVKSRGFRGVRGDPGTPAPLRRAAGQRLRDTFADLRRQSGAFVISAAGWREQAFEGDGHDNGAFTFALLEGLSTGKADVDKDGLVRVRELRDYVAQRVLDLSEGQQLPTARADTVGSDYVVCPTR